MIILSIRPCGTSRVLLHAVKSYDMGPSRLTSHPKGRCAADFYRPQKSIALAGFESATFGSSGKHTNHYTTKATISTRRPAILTEVFRRFPQTPQVNSGIVPQLRPRQLYSKSFSIHYSLITLSFYSV
jgi:hypothetical protein